MSLCVTFLGTGGAIPTTHRNTSAVFVRREGERFLFDCGEGSQRQMMRFGTGFAVSRLFVTHLHGDHVLGIPGFLQTCDFNDREEPLDIHVPRGKVDDMHGLIDATGSRPAFRVRIHEAIPGEVVHEGGEYKIRAFRTSHRARSVGYALVEADRKGRFDRERAEALGVPVGPAFSKLHDGEPVELEDGTVVRPEQVVGPPRPGRKLVYTGDTRPARQTREIATDADLLIHDATFGADRADRAVDTGHSTAREAGELAAEVGAKRLALMHLSSRYAGRAHQLEAEAAEVFDGEVFYAEDGQEVDVPFPEA